MKRYGTLSLLALAGTMVLSGCYFNTEVESSEVGLRMGDGTTVDEIVGSGRYTDMGPWANLQRIDVSSQRISYTDPALVTRDSQPIGISLEVVYARKRDADSIQHMWDNYREQARDNESLEEMVRGRIPASAKEVTARYTLQQLLGTGDVEDGGRSAVALEMHELLAPRLDEFGVELLDVGITNLDPDSSYLTLLQEKANVMLERDIATERTEQLREKLVQEQAQTDIELEEASRERRVREEQAQVYIDSPEMLELERLERLADILGDQHVVYFLPDGTDLTLFFSENGVNPVIQDEITSDDDDDEDS